MSDTSSPPAQVSVPTSQEKMARIIECLKDTSLTDTQTVDAAFGNLIVLARDSSPEVVFSHPDCLSIIGESLDKYKAEPDGTKVVITCLRLLSELSRMSVERTKTILDRFTIDNLTDIIAYSNDSNLMTTYQYLVQTVLNTLAGVQETLNKIRNQAKLDKERTLTVSEAIGSKTLKKVDDERINENKSLIFNILLRLVKRSASHIISATARDALLTLVMSNIDYQGLNFGVQLVEEDCVQDLLDIASEVEELKGPSSMETTSITDSLVAAVLERMYSCHDHDKVREIFREKTQSYLNKRLHNPDMDDKVRATKIFTILLSGPAEIGNSCIGQTGMIEMILAMAGSDEFSQQKAALDAIIAAASKKDKCTAIANLGEKVLNELRESRNEEIRLRALMGLSKVSSVGSTDASIRPFSGDANLNFARECISILTRPTPEFKLKQYAIESLAYLSFDGNVKMEIVRSRAALRALCDTLTFDINSPVVYSILNIFVNLTNSYDKQETSPELIELAKFAQQHIPEEHPMDKMEKVVDRLHKLTLNNVVSSFGPLVNIESKAAKDLLARILNALCFDPNNRGYLVQQGIIKLLMPLAQTDSERPDQACLLAAQALARLCMLTDPCIVYPGQRLLSVIKPIKRLLMPQCSGDQNFEALIALTNIVANKEPAQTLALRDNGFSLIEAYMFEENDLLRRAAVECVVNLIAHPQVVALYEGENDRVKYLVILCQEEDLSTVKAASGALAILGQRSQKACARIFTSNDWEKILIRLLSSEDMDLAHRAAIIIDSIIRCKDPSLAKRIFGSKLFEVMLALTLPQVENIKYEVKELIKICFKIGQRRKLIRDASKLDHLQLTENKDE